MASSRPRKLVSTPVPAEDTQRTYTRSEVFDDMSAAVAAAMDGEALCVVARGRPRWLVFQCPSGCGEILRINLDRQAGPSWRLTRRKGYLSLSPSVWRSTGCLAHFYLRRNAAWLLSVDEAPFGTIAESQWQSFLKRLMRRKD